MGRFMMLWIFAKECKTNQLWIKFLVQQHCTAAAHYILCPNQCSNSRAQRKPSILINKPLSVELSRETFKSPVAAFSSLLQWKQAAEGLLLFNTKAKHMEKLCSYNQLHPPTQPLLVSSILLCEPHLLSVINVTLLRLWSTVPVKLYFLPHVSIFDHSSFQHDYIWEYSKCGWSSLCSFTNRPITEQQYAETLRPSWCSALSDANEWFALRETLKIYYIYAFSYIYF